MDLNSKYAILCQQLGDMMANRDKIERRIQLLMNAIRALDAEAGRIKAAAAKVPAHGKVEGAKSD